MKYEYNLCDRLRSYEVVEWPIEIPFGDLTAEQTEAEFEWFLRVIPQRLQILMKTITSEDPEISEKLDYSPESLLPLGRWFSRHLHVRTRSEDEISRQKQTLTNPVHRIIADMTGIFPQEGFTAETVSLAYDIGVYIGWVFQKQFPNLRWTYKTKDWFASHPNEPILDGILGDFSPFREVLRFAHSTRSARTKPDGLKMVYDQRLKDVLPAVCSSLRNYTISTFRFAEPLWGISFPGPTRKYKKGFMLSIFNEYIPLRIRELRLTMRVEDPRSALGLNFGSESVGPLGAWLSRHIHTRGNKRIEIGREEERIENLLAFKYTPIAPYDRTLTSETLSLCFDGSLYVARTMHKKNKSIRWALADLKKLYLEGSEAPRNTFDLVLGFVEDVRRGKAEAEDFENRCAAWMND